jgi:hypothetical protein
VKTALAKAMPFHAPVIIVASPRPRVGKTLLARLLGDFYRYERRRATGYDFNTDENSLRKFQPEQTVAASIDDVRGQMALFDSLIVENDQVKVIDLNAGSFSAFFSFSQQIGFMDEALARGIAPVVFFFLTPDLSSAESYRELVRNFPNAFFAPVHNEIFGSTQHRDRYSLSSKEWVMRLPALAPNLRKHVERPPFYFADKTIANSTKIPLDLHIELQRWLRRTYSEIRDFDRRVRAFEAQVALDKSAEVTPRSQPRR